VSHVPTNSFQVVVVQWSADDFQSWVAEDIHALVGHEMISHVRPVAQAIKGMYADADALPRDTLSNLVSSASPVVVQAGLSSRRDEFDMHSGSSSNLDYLAFKDGVTSVASPSDCVRDHLTHSFVFRTSQIVRDWLQLDRSRPRHCHPRPADGAGPEMEHDVEGPQRDGLRLRQGDLAAGSEYGGSESNLDPLTYVVIACP
jgi:hypothetical protein